MAQAQKTLTHFTDGEPGLVPDGEITIPIRVCEACVQASGKGMRVGLVPGALPVYQRGG
jgi:hypothetical protein